ncbi:unnamed protein product [Fraxinus pennsylvanica]|uniref:ResB-like domain-containing protein n=1 Tax=Fraxinus pennsylvanica TaxID=56036 RepID=A0AAD1ZHH9_9LAMI|nr:unnamed protein product [Fraxinus pennsylvanica]
MCTSAYISNGEKNIHTDSRKREIRAFEEPATGTGRHSVILSKTQIHNIKNVFKFKTHNSLISASRSHKNGSTFTISCKLKTSKSDVNRKSKNKSSQTKIVVPELDGAPSLSEAEEGESGGDSGAPVKSPPLSILSNLPLAISEMFVVAALMALGTIVDQGEAPDFYFQKYPEDNPALGFFTWRWVLTLGFDSMFSSPVFLGTLALLGASLMACTYTTQIPVLKVFLKGPSLYAFRGLAGRFAPIGVHLALLLVMTGGTLSATGSFKGSVTVPQGLNFVTGDVLGPGGFLSTPSEAFNTEVHVNRSYMGYYDSGEVSQFHSNLSLFDLNGKEAMRKTISVNDPLR